jgi:L-threonylcarbamoyladenylate synthase
MSETVSIAEAGEASARAALERCVGDGGVALFPADTLYGLGCDPLNSVAVERIHAIKGRGEEKPSAVLFFSPLAMRELIATLDSPTRDAVGALLPGPVTLVVRNPEHRYRLACREDPERLGIRLIEGPLAGVGCALFQTSANRSAEPAPGRFEDIEPAILDAVDLAIDGGELGDEPSTVLDLTGLGAGEGWSLLRQGAMPEDELARRLAAITAITDSD